MDAAVKHPAPDRVKPSFVIFDIQSLALTAGQTKIIVMQFSYV